MYARMHGIYLIPATIILTKMKKIKVGMITKKERKSIWSSSYAPQLSYW